MDRHIKRWRTATAVGTSVLVLAACSQPPDQLSQSDPVNYFGGVAQAQEPGTARAGQSNAGPRLAISHTFALRLPSSEVESIQQKHLAECAKLGCTVLNTRVDRSSQG